MTREELDKILIEHKEWLNGEGGRRADLRGADLRGADLRGADLRGADLRGADFRRAKLPQKRIQIGPIGSRNDYTVYNVDTDNVLCGCWNNYKGGSLEEFKARIDEEYPSGRYRAEYLAAISAFELMKAAFQKEESERDKGKLAVDEDKDADAPTP